MASPDLEEEDGDVLSKATADPAITAADLEQALESYFKKMGHRNLQEVIDVIKEQRITWKSAPKVHKCGRFEVIYIVRT